MGLFKSLALIIQEIGKLEFTVREWDDTPQGNDVLVRTTYTVVSPGTELSRIHGTHSHPGEYPRFTGYLAEGVVEAVGPDVTAVKPGDYVRSAGGHLAHVISSENNLMVFNNNLKPGTIALAGLMGIPQRGVRNAKVHMGDTVVVFGLGPIGVFAAMFAKADGAGTVIGVDPLEYRRNLGAALGCDITVNPFEQDLHEILNQTLEKGAEVVIDATGTDKVISDTFQYTAPYGRVVVLGGVHKKVELDLYSDFQKKNLTLIGSGSNRPEDYPYDSWQNNLRTIITMIERGMIDPYPALTYLPVSQALEAYEHLHKRDEDVITYCFDWSDQEEVAREQGLL